MNWKILLKYLKDVNTIQNIKLKQNKIDIIARKLIDEKLIENKKKEKNIKQEIVFFLKLNTLRGVLNNYLPKEQHPNFKTNKLIINDFIKILSLTKNLSKRNNSQLYFVYLPEYDRYKINYDNTNYNLVKNIVNKLKIQFIDIHKEVFKKEQNPLKLFPFEQHVHYNIEGYKKVAETIYKFTKD